MKNAINVSIVRSGIGLPEDWWDTQGRFWVTSEIVGSVTGSVDVQWASTRHGLLVRLAMHYGDDGKSWSYDLIESSVLGHFLLFSGKNIVASFDFCGVGVDHKRHPFVRMGKCPRPKNRTEALISIITAIGRKDQDQDHD